MKSLLSIGAGAAVSANSSLDEIRRALSEKQRVEAEHVARFGHVHAPITLRHAGQAFVAVGDRMHTACVLSRLGWHFWGYICGSYDGPDGRDGPILRTNKR